MSGNASELELSQQRGPCSGMDSFTRNITCDVCGKNYKVISLQNVYDHCFLESLLTDSSVLQNSYYAKSNNFFALENTYMG